MNGNIILDIEKDSLIFGLNSSMLAEPVSNLFFGIAKKGWTKI